MNESNIKSQITSDWPRRNDILDTDRVQIFVKERWVLTANWNMTKIKVQSTRIQ